jgi:hypothetical protein
VVAIHIRSAPAGCLNWPNRSGKRKRTKAWEEKINKTGLDGGTIALLGLMCIVVLCRINSLISNEKETLTSYTVVVCILLKLFFSGQWNGISLLGGGGGGDIPRE